MRGYAKLYSNECLLNNCETNSGLVRLFMALDKMRPEDGTAEEQAATWDKAINSIVTSWIGHDPEGMNLSETYLGEQQVVSVCKVLMTMVGLKRVSFRGMRMRERGAEAIATMMIEHRKLEELDLRGNEWYATTGRLFTEALRKCENRVFNIQIDTDAMPDRIARKLRSQQGRNVKRKFPLDGVLASRAAGWGDGLTHHVQGTEQQEEENAEEDTAAAKSGPSDDEIRQEVAARVRATPAEEKYLTDALSLDPSAIECAMRCFDRCGAFAVQIAADFGIDSEAMRLLECVSRHDSLVAFLPETALLTGFEAHDDENGSSGIFEAFGGAYVACGDPIDTIIESVRRLSLARGLTDAAIASDAPILDPDVEERSPLKPGSNSDQIMPRQGSSRSGSPLMEVKARTPLLSPSHAPSELLQGITIARGSTLVLHQIEDLHRRIVSLRRLLALNESAGGSPSTPLPSSAVDEWMTAPNALVGAMEARDPPTTVVDAIYLTIRETCVLLRHVHQAVALTTAEGVDELKEFESNAAEMQRHIIDTTYKKSRRLLLLCDQSRYLHRTPEGKKGSELALHRYASCRPAFRRGEVGAFLCDVLEARRDVGATKRCELLSEFQDIVPPTALRAWIANRLRRDVGAWIGHRYATDFSNAEAFGGAAKHLPRANAAAGRALGEAIFFDVPDFPEDLLVGLAGIADENDLAVFCRQVAAVCRHEVIGELLPQPECSFEGGAEDGNNNRESNTPGDMLLHPSSSQTAELPPTATPDAGDGSVSIEQRLAPATPPTE